VEIKMKKQILSLIKDTILKEARSKTLIFLFGATTLLILLANSLLKLYISEVPQTGQAVLNASSSLSIMFSIINFWSLIVSAIFGISSIRSDFQEKIIYQYLSFPISRTQYMFSRIFGTWLLVFGYYLYSYLLAAILFSFASKTIALHWTHLISMGLMGLYVLIVIFISFVYSMMADKIPAFLLLFATIIVISASSNSMRILEYSEYFKDLSIFKIFAILVYCLLPRVNYVAELASAVMFHEEIRLNLPLESLHFIMTSLVMMYFANRFIKKKDF
jgi:ABC-type transport system involved in multi-copper enzyme maturation permease subunit